jgi:TonB family protein
MECLWPSTSARTAIRKTARNLFAAAAMLVALSSIPSPGTIASPSAAVPYSTPLAQNEKALRRVPSHISEFAQLSEPLALPECGDLRPPEALVTPDPLLLVQEDDIKVRVSFIVGSDGHVHSAFVLDSGGPDEDRIVLRVIRSWRYRPALCNGVPMDFEALVRFSIR